MPLYSEFKTLNKTDKSSISKIMDKLKSDLKQNDFHGSYFDRGAERDARICDERLAGHVGDGDDYYTIV